MGELDTLLRRNAVNEKARSLGYNIDAAYATTPRVGIWRVSAQSLSGDLRDGFLCNARGDSIDAIEEGLEVLLGICERGDPWPDER